MEKLVIKTKDLTPNFQVDGVSIASEFKNIERFYGIPATLHNVDEKFKTNTYLDVVKAATSELHFLAEGDKLQLLDPKSKFFDDETFDQAIELVEKNLGVQTERSSRLFQREATIKLKMIDDDHYFNDAFARKWTITRRPEGGIALNSAIVRLACTNGMMLPDKEFQVQSRTAIPAMEAMSQMHATISLMKVSEYLESMFTQDGKQVPCSFADMLDMHKCLSDLVEEGAEVADQLFPIEGIRMFYAAQGIETEKLARKWLDKLPTGLTYYQSLQILTNGAKQMTKPTVENQLKVVKFCTPKRMKNLKDTNLQWQGSPSWKDVEIAHWMGDN